MSTLRRLEAVPPPLLEAEPGDLLSLLGGPTLLHLKAGRKGLPGHPGALFVSVLLHGNETSGWHALRQLLRDFPAPPRDLLLFIGNVAAAERGVRTLEGQQDFNRMWRSPEGLAREVLDHAATLPLLGVVDLHNNTGRNPHYAVLTDFTPGSLGLAALFGNTAVFIEEPASVLTRAFSPCTPNVALELGPVSDREAAVRAYEYLRGLLDLQTIPEPDPAGTRLYRTLARVHLRQDVRFEFLSQGNHAFPAHRGGHEPVGGTGPAAQGSINGLDLLLDDAIEASNFDRLPAGTLFGLAVGGPALQVLDNSHRDVTDRFFEVKSARIVLKRPVVPAMYTTDPNVVRQDCLCYFMEPLSLDGHADGGAPRADGCR